MQRAKRSEKEKKEKEAAQRKEDDLMMIDAPETTPGPSAEGDKMDIDNEKEEKEKEEKKEGEPDKKKGADRTRMDKEKVGYELQNLSRVLPAQLPYINFPQNSRWEPVKKVCYLFLFFCIRGFANTL